MRMYHEAIATKKESFTLPKGMRLLCRHTRIPGYENHSVYDDGRVYSHIRNKFMKPAVTEKEYSVIYLKDRMGQKKKMRIHRLVAQAFIKNPRGVKTVNHIDGAKANNHWTNLEWVTIQENIKHAYDTGISKSGEHHHLAKLNEAQVIDIKFRYEAGQKLTDIARELDVSIQRVFYITRKGGWSRVSIEGLHNPYFNNEEETQ